MLASAVLRRTRGKAATTLLARTLPQRHPYSVQQQLEQPEEQHGHDELARPSDEWRQPSSKHPTKRISFREAPSYLTPNPAVHKPASPLALALSDRRKPPPVRIHKLPRGVWYRSPHSLLLYRRGGVEPPSPYECLVDIPGVGFETPMLQYVQVVSVPTADSPGACVLLHFDNRRYVFGHMAEGTQRVMAQRRIALSKLDEIFISGPVSWKTTGGLMGMILTIADVLASQQADEATSKKKTKKQTTFYKASLKIYGAENITHTVASGRQFIFRKGMPLRLHEIPHDSGKEYQAERKPDFEDANVMVWFVSLNPDDGETTTQGRKRSHDDMVAEDEGRASPSTSAKQKQANLDVVKTVVDNMFDSDWQLDALVETKLHEVKLPASIFVKGEDGKVKKYEGPMPGGNDSVPNITVYTRTPWPATKVRSLPPTSPSKQSMCYIVKGQQRRGKFNPKAAEELGVHKWDYRLLTSGQSVKGKDDMEVTPDMVMEKPVEGRGFAFIDLPDASYISQFLARPEWEDESLMGTIDIMYWNIGRGVASDERIAEFMRRHASKQHSVFSPDANSNEIVLNGAATSLIKMRRIDPDRFSLPVFSNRPKVRDVDPFEAAQIGEKLLQAPRVERQGDELLTKMDMMAPIRTMDRKVLSMADAARKEISDPAFLADIEASEHDIPNRDAEVIALGTGSALPSKYRNVSATLLRVPGCGNYMFDCGENTLGQLRRMYGYETADEILSDLRVIWISHMHADHHLGTASVIRAWHEATTPSLPVGSSSSLPRLTVVCPEHMAEWLREYSQVEDIGFERVRLVVPRGPVRSESIQNPITIAPGSHIALETGLKRIESCRVDHCHGALACVFTWPSGLKVAYSGDCRPSDAFAEIGRGCTLLIHESTLDDELRGDALAKKHCTMSEALGVARRMRARRVLLTHFSQRYPKIGNAFTKRRRASDAGSDASSSGGGGAGEDDQVVLLAFDMMRVKLGEFRQAERFLPALRMMLQEGIEAGDDDQD